MVKYWIWLATRRGLRTRDAWNIARHFPNAEAAYAADRAAYEQVADLRWTDSLLDKDLTPAEQILSQCEEKNISILTIQDAAYPERLAVTYDPPLVLYYKGTLPNLNGPIIGVVGTRKASFYGLYQTRKMAYGLARCGCTVVTGGARGIDTEAAKGALTGDGKVILVLGCGADVVYPKSNRELFEDVCFYGCILTEYPPGTEPYASHFPVRNRIISGLSLGILVAEAPEKSGALITANRALEQGRDVFTLPANLDTPSCQGNLKLLRDGAIPVLDPWDVAGEYQALFPEILRQEVIPEEKIPENPPEPRVNLDVESKKDIDKPKPKAYIDVKDSSKDLSQDEQTLLELLLEGPVHIDVLAERSHLGAGRALASLTLLEVKGMVQRPSARMYELAEK